MASGEEPTIANPVYPEEEDLLEDVDVEEDDDDDRSESTSDLHRLRHLSSPHVTLAIRSVGTADLKQDNTPVKKSAADESRKLFQRLWTDEDEIKLLQGFLEYTANRCGPQDTAAFYDQIKTKFQLDFNKNQLVEKLRRLKKKYRNVVNKFGSGKDHAFKTPHDQATFEIAAKIWGNLNSSHPNSNSAPANAGHGSDDDVNIISNPNFGDCLSPNFNGIDHINSSKLPRPKKRNHIGTIKFEEKQQFVPAVASINNYNSNYNSDNIINNNNQQTPMAAPVSSMIEETVKSCLAPVLKELFSGSLGANGSGSSCCGGHGLHGFGRDLVMPFGFFGRDSVTKDERWKKQQILELEVLSKRLELVQDQIKEQLNELRHATN